MLIHADAREHGDLAYYTNFIPRLRWAMALVPRHGEPRLLVSMSARDMPAMKLMTWIGDVRTGWDWAGGFDTWLAALQSEGEAALGTLGFNFISVDLHRAVERSLGNHIRLDDAAPFLPRERPLRPREMSLARDIGGLAAAAAAIAAAWRDGKGNEAALLEGERAARAAAAQDVRTLVSFDGGRTLAPFAGRFEARTESFLAYIAVKSAGFWAETFVTLSSPQLPRAEAALDATLAALAPGAEAARVYAAAMAAFAPLTLHPVLSGRVGRRIGFSLDEGGAIDAASAARIAPGSLYTLHVGAAGAIASAMVAVGKGGAELLWRSRQSG
jgi:Xaa-Pro aminopeptidase